MDKKPIKIIFFDYPGYASPKDKVIEEHNPQNPYFYFIGFSHQYAQYFRELYPRVRIEIWRLDARVDSKSSKEYNGLLGKVYPLRRGFIKYFPYNKDFIRDLKVETAEFRVFFFFQGLHVPFFTKLAILFPYEKKFAIQIGGGNPSYRNSVNWSLKTKIHELLDLHFFVKRMTKIFACTASEIEYIKTVLDETKIINRPFNFINSELFSPIDKKEARIKLGLRLDEKIIYQTGRAEPVKGTDVILRVWEKYLKSNGIKLILTGVHESDSLFESVVNSGCEYHSTVPYDQLPYWYSAADVYVYSPFNEETLQFGGVGSAPLEALACGTPIVCTTMINFPEFNSIKDEVEKVCRVPKDDEELSTAIIHFLRTGIDPLNARALVLRYFSKRKILESLQIIFQPEFQI